MEVVCDIVLKKATCFISLKEFDKATSELNWLLENIVGDTEYKALALFYKGKIDLFQKVQSQLDTY